MNELLKDAFPAQAPADGTLGRVQAAAAAKAALRSKRRRSAGAGIAIGGPLATFVVFPAAILALHSVWVARSEAILQTDWEAGKGFTTTHHQPDFFVEIDPGGGGRLVTDEGTYWQDEALGVEIFKPRTAPDVRMTPWGPSTPVSQLRPDQRWKSLPEFGMSITALTGLYPVVPTSLSSAKLVKTYVDGMTVSWDMRFSGSLLRDLRTTKSGRILHHTTTERKPKLTPDQARRDLLGYSGVTQVRLSDWCAQIAAALPQQPAAVQRDRTMTAELLGVWPVEDGLGVMVIQYRGQPAPDGGFLPFQRSVRGSDVLAVRPILRGISEAKGVRHLEAVFAPMPSALAAWPGAKAEPKPLFSRAGWMSLSVGSSSAQRAEAELELANIHRMPWPQRRSAAQAVLNRPGMESWPELSKEARRLMNEDSGAQP